MSGRFAFAPSFQGGYFQRFGASEWLWGAKLSYNYLGATSTNTNSIIPQFGSYTTVANPIPVGFSGPAYVREAKTSVVHEIDFIPFLGRAFGQSYLYAGGGPTLSQARSQLNGRMLWLLSQSRSSNLRATKHRGSRGLIVDAEAQAFFEARRQVGGCIGRGQTPNPASATRWARRRRSPPPSGHH